MHRLLFAALAVFVLFTGGKAEAGMRLCNNSNETIYTAIGFQYQDDWFAEGWWEIFPGNCTYVIEGPLDGRYYYVRAEGANGSVWNGDFYFCTMETRFMIIDREDCAGPIIDREGFWQIDTGDSVEHTHNFNP